MTDLFGNEDPAKTAKPVVYERETAKIPAEQYVTNYSLISDLEYKGNPIRRGRLEDGTEVWVITDAIAAVTESKNPQNYWYKTRSRMKDEGCEWVTNWHILKIKAADGKYYDTQVMTPPQLLRMLQSLPKEYALLTDRESKGTFGKTTGEMKKEKGLAKIESLRDSMSVTELLAQEVSDTAISLLISQRNPQGFAENAVQVDRGSAAGAKVLADLNRLLEA